MSWGLKPSGSPGINLTDLCPAAGRGFENEKALVAWYDNSDQTGQAKAQRAASSRCTLTDLNQKLNLKVNLPSRVFSSSSSCTLAELISKSFLRDHVSQTHQMSWEFCIRTNCMCGRCKTATMIFNCFPGIVSMLGTCIVFFLFWTPPHPSGTPGRLKQTATAVQRQYLTQVCSPFIFMSFPPSLPPWLSRADLSLPLEFSTDVKEIMKKHQIWRTVCIIFSRGIQVVLFTAWNTVPLTVQVSFIPCFHAVSKNVMNLLKYCTILSYLGNFVLLLLICH